MIDEQEASQQILDIMNRLCDQGANVFVAIEYPAAPYEERRLAVLTTCAPDPTATKKLENILGFFARLNQKVNDIARSTKNAQRDFETELSQSSPEDLVGEDE